MNPRRIRPYVKASQIALEERNRDMWIQGLYFYQGTATALTNLFKKKGERLQSYIDKPIRLTPKTPEEIEADKELQTRKLIAYLNGLARKAGEAELDNPEVDNG